MPGSSGKKRRLGRGLLRCRALRAYPAKAAAPSSRRVLFIATGALMSQTTFLQKESIPAVAHLVELTAPEKES